MKKAAIDKANVRLVKAREALTRARAARDHPAFEAAWTDFLIFLNAIPTILEKGARDNPQTRQWWFSNKRKQIDGDPLLSYLHQARNVDEHGLEPTIQLDPGGVGLGAGGQGLFIEHLEVGSGGMHGKVMPLDGGPLRVAVTLPHPRLVAVTDDRFGTIFDPPTKHLGKALPNTSPAAVGELGLAYYEALVAEAAQKVV